MTRPARWRNDRRARTLSVPAALLALALVLGACGDQDDDRAADPEATSASPTPEESASPSEKPAPRTEPECAGVWVVGQKLPRPYRGCFDADQERWVKPGIVRCSSGQQVVTYGRHHYAVQNQPVIQTDGPRVRDKKFLALMDTCSA